MGCTQLQYQNGSCGSGGSFGKDGANVGAFEHLAGRGGSGASGFDGSSGGTGGGKPLTGRTAIPTTGCNPKYCWEAGPGTPAAADPGLPEIRIEDVASLAPAPASDRQEPASHVAVRRMPANFISAAAEHVVAGTLLGRPVEVRFTPVQYTWDTGDGERVESSTPGATWKALRKPEYSGPPPATAIANAATTP